jgi:hypothetical protein
MTDSSKAGFFQGVIRGTHNGYDENCKIFIAGEYARCYHGHNSLPEGCPEEILKAALLSTVDMLESMSLRESLAELTRRVIGS